MAISKEDKIVLSKAAIAAIDSLHGSNNEILKITHGLSNTDIKDDLKNKERILELENIVKQTFTNLIGKDTDFSSDEINHLLTLASAESKKKKESSVEKKKRFEEFKKVIATENNRFMQDMISTRKHNRKQLYASYDLILSIIPKMKLAVETWVNSIISPDDFTKGSLNIINKNIQLDDNDNIFFKKAMKALADKFSIEKNLKKDVMDYLIKGELFFLVLSLNDELKTLLQENVTGSANIEYTKLSNKFEIETLNESNALNHFNLDASFLQEGYKLFNSGKDNKECTKEIFINEMNLLMENGLVIGSSKQFLTEDAKLENEFTSNNYLVNSEASNKEIDKLKFSTNSASLKKLLPENIVKLEFNEKCFGYVYIDSIVDENINNATYIGNGQQNINITTNSPLGTVLYSGKDTPANSEGLGQATGELGAAMDAKLQFIASAFANRLSVEQNISVLKDNEELKYALYNSLKIRKLLVKDKLRVTFFKPSEVIHINRGSSIFDNILFFAKLYIASLITILMQNIIRGGDKRAYYVDTGLENDISNTVQQVIKDVKSKDITGIHNMDIFSILNIVGETSDYYFPTIDDTKPITIDTVSGLENKSLDNDFLNWLSNNIFSGMGIPSAYLTEVENIDFAKTLSMQNTRFIRDVVAEQSITSEGYTALLQLLFTIEFKQPVNSENKEEDSSNNKKESKVQTDILSLINPMDIEVRFPSPMSLNMTNLTDQTSNLNSLIDSFADNIDWESADAEKAKLRLKTEMFRQYIPNIDWDTIDNIINKIKIDLNKQKIKSNIKNKKDATDMANDAGIDTDNTTDDTNTDNNDLDLDTES